MIHIDRVPKREALITCDNCGKGYGIIGITEGFGASKSLVMPIAHRCICGNLIEENVTITFTVLNSPANSARYRKKKFKDLF